MTYNEAEPSSPERRRLAMIGGGLAIFLVAVVATLFMLTRPGREATTPLPESEVAQQRSPTFSPTPAQPSGTPTPFPTPTPQPPYEHEVKPGEGLIDIVQQYGYQTLDIFDAIVAINGLASPDDIQVGQVLLIPRQTATPRPTPGLDETDLPPEEAPPVGATSPSVQGGDPENRVTSADGRFWIHTVREGETIAQIALLYDSHVPCILQNNLFDFVDQEPIIFVGQQINVCVISTLTPTPSSTGDPFNSTSTPTPTLSPPLLLSPPDGASFGRGQQVTLRWVATFPLKVSQRYQVIVQDVAGNREFRALTTANAFTLPNDLRPSLGQSINYDWQILIVEGTMADAPIISGLGEIRQFTWGG